MSPVVRSGRHCASFVTYVPAGRATSWGQTPGRGANGRFGGSDRQRRRAAQIGPAFLACDREGGRDRRVAGRAADAQLAAASRAGGGELGLVLGEVALDVAAAEAERGPVAEGPAALLSEPVGGAAHAPHPRCSGPRLSTELQRHGRRPRRCAGSSRSPLRVTSWYAPADDRGARLGRAHPREHRTSPPSIRR